MALGLAVWRCGHSTPNAQPLPRADARFVGSREPWWNIGGHSDSGLDLFHDVPGRHLCLIGRRMCTANDHGARCLTCRCQCPGNSGQSDASVNGNTVRLTWADDHQRSADGPTDYLREPFDGAEFQAALDRTISR